jgi:hypothetical protein
MRRVARTFRAPTAAAESAAQHDGWLRAIARVRS